jgi:polar amino acid transport system substrate-binding protein
MKKLRLLMTTVGLVTVFMSFTSCAPKEAETVSITVDERPYTDFIGKKFAVMDGTGYEAIVEEVFKSENYVLYTENTESVPLMESGAVEAVIGDYTAAIPWVSEIGADTYAISRIPTDLAGYEYAAMAHTAEIAEDFNVFLATLKSDGTLAEMYTRWVDNFDSTAVPTIAEVYTPQNGTANGNMNVGTNTGCAPFVMSDKNGSPTGFEVELMTRYADYKGKSITFTEKSFNDLIPYYTSGEADFIAAMCYDITEGVTGIIFTDPYADAPLAAIYKK